MRKLKLHMSLSLDGFVGRNDGGLDWMTWDADDILADYINNLTDSCDTIVMGRKMTDGFVNYWTSVTSDPKHEEYTFAKKMVDIPKVVFTKTVEESPWANTTLAKGDLADEINKLKNSPGSGIVVYGGAELVSSLIKSNLIDEYHLFIHPAAIGEGLTIFRGVDKLLKLKLIKSTATTVGITINHYEPFM